MTRGEKNQVIDALAVRLSENDNFYLTDISELTVEDSNSLRGVFHEKGLKVEVVKNTLLQKAMEKVEGKNFDELYPTLVGSTSILFTESGSLPAKVIKDFRKKFPKPVLKGAFVEESVYVGDDMLDFLSSVKSKNELIADVVALLQSPAKNVISSLQSGGQTLVGLLKTLSEKEGN